MPNWSMRRELTNCPNEDCDYSDWLEKFVFIGDDEYPTDEEFVLHGVCPKCGTRVKLTIEPRVDYYVWEEKDDT